ncbi:putative peptide chain release factor 1, mitochondrial [Erysiphe neolycopersici]|uniref:Putative peptide chain release factor 1, mitochondrial n=1 Tax=Erysiphe neolycopersici TaxID=212602 RepID=A0A420HWT8_9PEZI|nr:putative peptide chain release factor 1, mitochondrial [Erysiphe neolycopersici]
MFKSRNIYQLSLGLCLKFRRREIKRLASSFSHGSLSAALVARARNMALEHDRLCQEFTETFDNKVAKRVGELKRITEALKQWEAHEKSLIELNSLLADPTTDAELYNLVVDDIDETKSKIQVVSKNLAIALTPVHPFEKFPCLLELRPGAGGSEAAIFATDLLRMYMAYCARVGLHASILKYETTDGPESPLTEAVIEVDTVGAYGKLRTEAGVHRVQRVPATESKGRVHTSAVGVLVLPSLPTSSKENQLLSEADLNDPSSDYYVNPTDVRTDVMRARGAGGQHVNTTDSAVRLTHIPTNTVVAIQDSRSQHANRAKAWQLLRSKLAQARRDAREEEIIKLRRGVIGVAKMGRGDKVRTYNWGQQRVSDHRSGFHSYNLDDVISGGLELDKIIESVRTWQLENEMEAMLQDEKTSTKNKK